MLGQPVPLRLSTYDTGGNVILTLFTFTPLRDQDGYSYDRENTQSAARTLNRRPYARQEIRTLTLAAGFLLNAANLRNVQRLYDAHKIEWQRLVNGKESWVEFSLDATGDQTFERVEDIDPLRRITITLVQAAPIWFTDFENSKVAMPV
jgi:hypothetical protein